MTKYDKLIKEIELVTDQGVTLEHAERVAGLALDTMNEISASLTVSDKNRRMRKRAVKAIRAAIRMDEIKKHDKKPTESYLEDVLNLNPLVNTEEEAFDDSEVFTDELERMFGIAKEAHLYYRGISRGRYE